MAEAVVGVIASIVQLVDFSSKVAHRLDEFHSIAGEIPKSFRQVKIELPLLGTTLQQMKGAIEADLVADRSKTALLPVIVGCYEQITQLDAILTKTLPESHDSWQKRGTKAIISLHHDSKIESIMRAVRNHIGSLTFYCAAVSSTLQSLTGRCIVRNLHELKSNSSVDAKLCKIRQWLSAPDPSTNFQKALKLRQADTGLWFLESNKYTKWKTNAASASPLWLYGIPGCGKTILSSTVLQNVLRYCQDNPGKVTVYFFFDFHDMQKQDPEKMLRSLLCQLLQQSIKIPPSLDTLFSLCESGQRQPSMHGLLETLRLMIQELPQVYVLLDALDECVQRADLMDMLETIAGWQFQNLHLLVTSRRERDIENSLEVFVDGQHRICLQSALVDKDIQRYVRRRLSDDKRLRKWERDVAIMRDIEATLMRGAKGMCVYLTIRPWYPVLTIMLGFGGLFVS